MMNSVKIIINDETIREIELDSKSTFKLLKLINNAISYVS